MARPEATIDLVELEKLCALQCTTEEIASWFRVTTRTIERRQKMPKFREAMERGRAKGRMSIRRAQMKMVESGNATMAIWLGKQLLGQREPERAFPEGNGLPCVVVIPNGNHREMWEPDDDSVCDVPVPGRPVLVGS